MGSVHYLPSSEAQRREYELESNVRRRLRWRIAQRPHVIEARIDAATEFLNRWMALTDATVEELETAIARATDAIREGQTVNRALHHALSASLTFPGRDHA